MSRSALGPERARRRWRQLQRLFESVCKETAVCIDDNDDDDKKNHGQFSNVNLEVLAGLVKEKNLDALRRAGGVDKIASALESNIDKGIKGDPEDLHRRRCVFGSNNYMKATKGFSQYALEALKDFSILFLLCDSTLNLAMEIKKHGWKDGWYDGGLIFLAVFVVIAVTTVGKFREDKLLKSNEAKLLKSNETDNITVVRDGLRQQVSTIDVVVGDIVVKSNETDNITVVRNGRRQQVSTLDVVVGDIVVLSTGDLVPADGLLLPINFSPFHVTDIEDSNHRDKVDRLHPFLPSGAKVGAKVVGGVGHGPYNMPSNMSSGMPSGTNVIGRASQEVGTMLVTSVGINLISSDSNKQKTVPFQAQFDKLSSYKENIGLGVTLLLLVVSFVECFKSKTENNENQKVEINGKKTEMREMMNAAIQVIQEQKLVLRGIATKAAVFLMAIPEGFSLAVTLILTYSTRIMTRTVQAKVRKLFACLTAGYVTTILTDETSLVNSSQIMKLAGVFLGDTFNILRTGDKGLAPNVIQALHQGIGLNTTGSLVSNPTERALLTWAALKLGMDMEELKRTFTVSAADNPLNGAGDNVCKVLIRERGELETIIHVHKKGPAKKILSMCSSYYDRKGNCKAIRTEERSRLEDFIKYKESNGIQCIAYAYLETTQRSQPHPKGDLSLSHGVPGDLKSANDNDLTLLGVAALLPLCQPKVKRAVEACRDAGINIIIVSGDQFPMARALATECGICKPHRFVVEGAEFRSWPTCERMRNVDQISIIKGSSPSDKLLLAQCLKQEGHVVAVTGVCSSDAPAMKDADVGLSMGIRGTEVAKESSDIIIMDDSLTSIVSVLTWGRCIYNNIQKFIQLHLTVNIAGLAINFIAAVSLGDEAPFTTLQMLWVNFIVDTLGFLAVANELPTKEVAVERPIPRSEPLITNVMWRNITTQAVFQIVVVLSLQFTGNSIMSMHERVKKPLLFNTFVLCQIFNLFSSRELEGKNIFTVIHPKKLFCGTLGLTLVLQVVFIEFLGSFFNAERLNWGQWIACVGIAAVSWPVGWVAKSIPVPDTHLNHSFIGLFSRVRLHDIWIRLHNIWIKTKLGPESLPLTAKDV